MALATVYVTDDQFAGGFQMALELETRFFGFIMYKKCQHAILSMGFLGEKLSAHSHTIREDIIHATLFAKAVYQSQPTGYGRV